MKNRRGNSRICCVQTGFKETDVCNYWAPLFPMLYKKTVEELEEEYISSLSSWKIRYPPV